MRSGDKVRVKTANKHAGRTGTVTGDTQASKSVDVEFDDESTSWHSFAEEELEVIEYGE
jgi:hypothetical protein